MQLLKDKVILVTGGSGGVGRGICQAVAENGGKVAFTWNKNTGAASETKAMLHNKGCEVLSIQADFADKKAAANVVSKVMEKWGRIDGLVNNAAISEAVPFVLIDDEELLGILQINFIAAFQLSREAIRSMISQKYGRIVNISSIAGSNTIPGPVHYASSKAALDGMTRSLAHETGPYGILVNSISAGIFEGGLKSTIPQNHQKRYKDACSLSRFGEPLECGEFACWLLSEKNTYINGSILAQDGGTLG